MPYNKRGKKLILLISSVNRMSRSHPIAIDAAKACFAEPAQLVAEGRGLVECVGGAVVMEKIVPLELFVTLIAAQVASDCEALLAHNLVILTREEIGDLAVGGLDDIGQQQRSPRLKNRRYVFEKLLLAFAREVMDTERRKDAAQIGG